MFNLIFSFSLLCSYSFTANAQSIVNLVIESSYPCHDVPNQKVNFTIKPKTFSYPQIVDLILITPIELGNQLKYSASIDLEDKIGLKTWQRLIQIEDDFCRAMKIYMGNFAYDMETAMGILPRGACPIPRGTYHAVNYTADYGLMKIQGFPLGRMRVTARYIEKSSKNVVLCLVLMVSHMH